MNPCRARWWSWQTRWQDELIVPILQVSKEALLAFGEVTMTFISYVMAVANEVLKSKGKRQTVQPEEVLDVSARNLAIISC